MNPRDPSGPLPASPFVIEDLRRRAEAFDAARRASWSWQGDRLDAVQETLDRLADPGLDRMAAAPEPDGLEEPSDPPTRFPVLRLVLVPEWGEALGRYAPARPEAQDPCHVFLQGFDDRLTLRVQGPVQPGGIRLGYRPADPEQPDRSCSCRPLPPERALFALPVLNGGGDRGSLWSADDLDARQVLGLRGASLRLEVELEGRTLTLPTPRLPPLQRPHLRRGAESPGSPSGRFEARLDRAIAAYLREDGGSFREILVGDPAHFLAVVSGEENVVPLFPSGSDRARGHVPPECLLLDKRGHHPESGHATDRIPWRELGRWAALWLRAMLAEIHADGQEAWEAFSGELVAMHPQLAVGFLRDEDR